MVDPLIMDKGHGMIVDKQRFGVSEKLGFIKTTIKFALKRPELIDQLLESFEKKLMEERVTSK